MFHVMGRFKDRGRVRGLNIQLVQYKNHYAYGESPQRCVCVCVSVLSQVFLSFLNIFI